MQKTILSLVIIAAVVAGGWYMLTSKTRVANASVAIVNGEKLTRSDLDTVVAQVAKGQGTDTTTLTAEAKTELEKQSLDVLISQTLLRQGVKREGVEISDEAVEAQITTIKSSLGDDAAFQTALKQEGITEEKLRTQVKQDLALQAYLNQKLGFSTLTASDAEIEAAYAQASQGAQNVPALSEVRDQVKQLVINQKQQALVTSHIDALKADANIQILI
jgi:parvulin-like peptidyl-prolyl isomerase